MESSDWLDMTLHASHASRSTKNMARGLWRVAEAVTLVSRHRPNGLCNFTCRRTEALQMDRPARLRIWRPS